MDEFESIDTEEELRESYPFLFGDVAEGAWDPPGYKLSPEQEKFRETQRQKLLEERIVVDEHGENYHYIDEITDEMLPTVNFRRYDNLFIARPANAILKTPEGEQNKGQRRLFGDLWLEGEMNVLYGETGCGKSVLAMQIARSLAGGPQFEPFGMDVEPGRVAYFDFELSEQHFRARYTSDAPGTDETAPFLDNLIICTAQTLRSLPPGFESLHDLLVHSISQIVDVFGVRYVIIDNITWLSPNLESSPNAQRLMKTLVQLKKELGISILLLAHTKKRPPNTRIDIEHLNGSKMLAMFVEGMFAIGTSRRGKRIRYIKAPKHRYSADRDAEAEVATVRIGKEGNFLGFTFEGHTDERFHIGWGYGEASVKRPEFVAEVVEQAKRQLTQQEIADELGVSQATVSRCLKAADEGEMPLSL